MSKTMVALDFSTRKEVYEFLLKFKEPIYVKIGMELTYSFGFEIVREVKAMGHQIFLDLKLHDIPNTVKQAMKNLAKLDVDVVNLHAAGGSAMMKAAIEGLKEGAVNGKRPLCIAVTQLTSTSQEAMNEELLIPGEDVYKRQAKRFQMERRGKLKEGNASDFVLMDLDSVRKIEKQGFYSMGKNTPFDGIVCSGFAVKTFVDGICVYDNREGLLK